MKHISSLIPDNLGIPTKNGVEEMNKTFTCEGRFTWTSITVTINTIKATQMMNLKCCRVSFFGRGAPARGGDIRQSV